MKSMLVDDFYSHDGYLRPNGQLSTDVYLVQTKTPRESHSKWDVFKVVKAILGDEATSIRLSRRSASWKHRNRQALIHEADGDRSVTLTQGSKWPEPSTIPNMAICWLSGKTRC